MVVYYCMSHGSTGVDIIKEDNRAPVSSKELSSFERDKIIEKKKNFSYPFVYYFYILGIVLSVRDILTHLILITTQ